MQTSVLLFMYSNYALLNPDLHFRVFVGGYDFCVDNSVPYLHCVLFRIVFCEPRFYCSCWNYVLLNPGLHGARPRRFLVRVINYIFPQKDNLCLLRKVARWGSAGTPHERAVSLLRVVQNLLEQSDVPVSAVGTSNEASPAGTQQIVQSTNDRGQSSQQNNDLAVARQNESSRQIMQNFRTLSSGYSARNQSRNQSRPPPAKRQKSGSYIPKETWTHEFFCLSECRK